MRFATLLAVLSTSCSLEVAAHVQEGKSLNGKSLNGKSLNGKSLNGSGLGDALVWVSLEGIALPNATLDEAWLEGTELVGRAGDQQLEGTELEGAQLAGRAEGGQDVTVRLRRAIAPAPGSDAWSYDLDVWTDQGWVPVCSDGDEALEATALAGWWNPEIGTPGAGGHIDDPDRITFACPGASGGAVGKCLELGYQPWAGLAAHHGSCVRAIRADYCGDGRSYTTDGKLIDIYDAIGVQDDTEDWPFEAEWDAGGARCVTGHNRAADTVPCYRQRIVQSCGRPEHFHSGTLVMTETPPD